MTSFTATPAADRDHRDPHGYVRQLYTSNASSLLAYTTRILADAHHAEDVVQETMLRAWKHSEQLSPDRGSVPGWLNRVARNLALDKIRARNARPTEVEESTSSPDVVADHSGNVVESVYLAQALARVSPKHREALMAMYFADRTAGEAAEYLGIPVGTVKTRVYHGLKRLKAVLEEEPAFRDR
jgi:RNA polymerase sigma-70 factor (ECF subfamily)